MKTRTLLFRIGTIAVLIAIAATMFVIGRGHTVYIDNTKLEYDGQEYVGPYKAVIYVDGEQVAKLYDKERGMSTCIGQTFKMDMKVTQEKGGKEQFFSVSMPLPYDMDGIMINLPALLNGLPQSAYMSEFIIQDEVEEETSTEDEFGISTEF